MVFWRSILLIDTLYCVFCYNFQATQKKIVTADAYVAGLWLALLPSFNSILSKCILTELLHLMAACDVPGIKRLVPPKWREWEFFNNIYELVGVPVVTVQLRYNGWVTELQDLERSR